MLVSQWAGHAWEKLCESYDFEGSARALGMLITADGSDDDNIKVQLQGLTGYTFSDADGGSEGEVLLLSTYRSIERSLENITNI